jgi:ABC-2 type transport system ATP-binding protein
MATPSPTAPAGAGIRLHGLEKTFGTPHGPVRAVRGIDIAIAPGETLALLGPNGAGKSTTIDMLLGLTRPDAGDVELFGGSPERAVAEGRVGAMLLTGALVLGLRVRDLMMLMASLYAS